MTTFELSENSFFEYGSFKELVESGKGKKSPLDLYKSLFYKYDLGILFGPPHCGKDLFATMIGEEAIKKMDENGDEDRSVLYLDFEKSDQQQRWRYSDSGTEGYHVFSERMIRITYLDGEGRKLTAENLLKGLRDLIKQLRARVIIIDNLTYLCRGQMGSKASDFIQLFDYLKKDYYLSVLVLVHTQRADDYKPITLKDLKGGGFLSSIADSIFAMNMSRRGNDIRYVKQLKSSCSEIEYGADNVLVYKKERDTDGALHFNLEGTTPEDEQLDIDYEAEQELRNKIGLLNYQRWSVRKIAKKLNISRMRVWRYIHGV